MNQLLNRTFVLFICALLSIFKAEAQCSTVNLNWDYLDFLDLNFVTLAQSQSQKFALGTQYVTFTHNYTGTNIVGENATHTGETGSYGTGADVQLMGDGAVTTTFQNSVTNVKFSVYDIDYNQKVTVTALNGATAINVTMVKVSGTNLTIAGSGTTSASATAGATNAIALTSSDGTINVDIAGPVTSFTITVTQTGTKTTGPASGQEDGSFWISDLQACSVGTFSANYRSVSQPLTGMPSYVLAVRNNNVYYVNPANGKARPLFTDPGHTNINSVAYDPVNYMVYYTYSLTSSPSTDRTLRRYDYEMDTFGIVTTDVRTTGLILHDNGVESGAASFYDGSLYLGIEANGTGYSTGRESKVWKIDFNASKQPTIATQVYAIDGGNHDWGDFGVANGMFYNFDGKAGNEDVSSMNLYTRSLTNIAIPTALPKQTSIDWQENIYNMGNTGASPSTGFIALYNTSAGTQGTQNTITFYGASQTGSWGDGGEAFKPKTDYGDAPATFDPGPLPATHEKDTTLRLGATEDIEWIKTASANATADGADEDGISGSLTIGTGTTSFSFNVSVYNNTGANATLIGWIDLNNDGVFQAGEGRSYTVASSTSQQTVSIAWTSVTVSAPVTSVIFMRLRLTSAANGMTTSNTTGYFYDGEVEDYPVTVSAVLPGELAFTANKVNEVKAELNWVPSSETGLEKYALQRSADGINWVSIYEISATGNSTSYKYTDANPVKPNSYYRLKVVATNDVIQFSNTQKLDFRQISNVSLSPNPANQVAVLQMKSAVRGNAVISVIDMNGRVTGVQNAVVISGNNSVNLEIIPKLNNGLYRVRIQFNNDIYTVNLLIAK